MESSASEETGRLVYSIKSMLRRMSDGEASISPYDTAWVALVEGVRGPQFPSTLEWIARNQLPDGSWGEPEIFFAHDRLVNTLACVIALKSWNVHPENFKRGLTFVKENMCRLEEENPEHMPVGFEFTFPALLEMARNLNLGLPEDSPGLREIYSTRDIKLSKMPRDIMHTVPTTMLFSLEGRTGLDWEKLLKLQSRDGSFIFSPASTAFAFMKTKDKNCLTYLTKAIDKFGGAVPHVYPVDLFEHLWAVDRLHRLGLSRLLEQEMNECIKYVSRYWTDKGIGWARYSEVHDVDDTAMGFRLLRLHGHNVSAEVFRNFKSGDEFFCTLGQSMQSVTVMFNLFRASQLLFPGEKNLEDAKDFTIRFLREKQANNELIDKWVMAKDLPGEVSYALEVPWYASLPRLETRFYIEQYGGRNDAWIGKNLYRFPYVNNDDYLELAKKDFNFCQELHAIEWHNMQKWFTDCGLKDYGSSRKSLLLAYYLAAASIFEPERAGERIAWAKTAVLMETITSHFNGEECYRSDLRKSFAHAFKTSTSIPYLIARPSNVTELGHRLLGSVLSTLSHFSMDAISVHRRDISHLFHQAWEKWLLTWQEGGDGDYRDESELLVETINLISGRTPVEGLMPNPHYKRLFNITNRVCATGRGTTLVIESGMQELVQLVLENSSEDDVVDAKIKKTFLMVAKTFYYAAYFDSETINFHIAKVLFERVG